VHPTVRKVAQSHPQDRTPEVPEPISNALPQCTPALDARRHLGRRASPEDLEPGLPPAPQPGGVRTEQPFPDIRCTCAPASWRGYRQTMLPARGRGFGHRGRTIGTNIDPPAGKTGGEASILALPPDRQGQLIVRDDHPSGARCLVDDHH
jgi:hypothetical protein